MICEFMRIARNVATRYKQCKNRRSSSEMRICKLYFVSFQVFWFGYWPAYILRIIMPNFFF